MADTPTFIPFFNHLQEQVHSIPWWTLMDPTMMARMQHHCQRFRQQYQAGHQHRGNEQQPCSSRQAQAGANTTARSHCPGAPTQANAECQNQGQRFNWEELLINAPAIVEAVLGDFLQPEPQKQEQQKEDANAEKSEAATLAQPPVAPASEAIVVPASENSTDTSFQIKLNVSTYLPEELSVKTKDNFIIVEGKQAEKEDEQGQGLISTSFTRKFGIPDGIKPETIVSHFTTDGWLIISAPVPVVEKVNHNERRSVPINFTGEGASSSLPKENNNEAASENMEN